MKPGRPIEYDDQHHRDQRRYQAKWISKNREVKRATNLKSKRRQAEKRKHSPTSKVSDEELDRKAAEWLKRRTG